MNLSDYIVDYLIKQGVRHVFGYPGGMVTHLMDSLSIREGEIQAHLTHHEQGAAFAACGYAQAINALGVAFATSGPGATNLITGICNAYFESVPVLFITGQVNTFESAEGKAVRQCGFQETDIVSMVRSVTKFVAYVEDARKIRYYLDKAVFEACHGRKGAVLLDIPMNIMRAEVDPDALVPYKAEEAADAGDAAGGAEQILMELRRAERPVFLFGNGIKSSGVEMLARKLMTRFQVPVVTSMIAVDIPGACPQFFGFIGAYGNRAANFIVAKADLLVSFGSRLDIRQVGKQRENFAPHAKIIRIDIDKGELAYKVHEDEFAIRADVGEVLKILCGERLEKSYDAWLEICGFIRARTEGRDEREPNIRMNSFFDVLPRHSLLCVDVGQNQVWAAQAAVKAGNHRLLFSGSNGAMGYALPAAVGACIATGETTYVITGDGGLQMNIQELQTVVREQLPVKIMILNNNALGMIRHFQEMYFKKRYCMTVKGKGFSNPDFGKIARAYGIDYRLVDGERQKQWFQDCPGPEILELRLEGDTFVFPKLEYGRPNQDQEPLLDREEYRLLMDDKALLEEIRKDRGERAEIAAYPTRGEKAQNN